MDAQTEKATKLAEATAAEIVAVLPEPAGDLVPYEQADPELRSPTRHAASLLADVALGAARNPDRVTPASARRGNL